MNTNLFAILTSPGFAREFDKADPEGDAIEAEFGLFVSQEDRPIPTTWTLGTPDPLAQLGDDAE